jgi:hypothetical protein
MKDQSWHKLKNNSRIPLNIEENPKKKEKIRQYNRFPGPDTNTGPSESE